MNTIIKFFIENKLVAFMLFLLLFGWGVSNAPFGWHLGMFPSAPVAVDAIPDLGENQQIIYTAWEGHAPQDIEDQITYPLTTSLMGVPGVKTIRSSSMFGFSTLYIIFEEDVEFYWSRSRILEKLNALPDRLLPPGISPTLGPDATGLGQVFWYTLEGRDKQGQVTGGWDLQELRSIQDEQVKYGLASASGVAEVASIGGFVKEYQVDVDPELMKSYHVSLTDVVQAVKESNRDIGAKTIEINQVEYMIRGLGAIKSIVALENTVVKSNSYTAIRLKDIANVSLGPVTRRGILDKEGAEVVGGVVVARYGANPMEVIQGVKAKIDEIASGLPAKVLKDGRTSKLTIVPFYDRSELIGETVHTLETALNIELLITILVVILFLLNLRAAVLVSSILPMAIVMVFSVMKAFGVAANIVALSGIAIAIGTMVDLGIILSENMIRHLDQRDKNTPIKKTVYLATTEVSGAILTAVMTTVISFVPVFMMIGAEGKLFRPLAFTKTVALLAAAMVTLFLIPPLATVLFRKYHTRKGGGYIWNGILILLGIWAIGAGYFLGSAVLIFGVLGILDRYYSDRAKEYKNPKDRITLLAQFFTTKKDQVYTGVIALTLVVLLAIYWQPLGVGTPFFPNVVLVAIVCFGVVGFFSFFKKKYSSVLQWALRHKGLFLLLPAGILVFGIWIWRHTGQEFMPVLDEGSFLLMPSSMPHAGVTENKRVLQQLNRAVAQLPEIETVVGKAGRIASALDPAPLSMYENIIRYKPEYSLDQEGKRVRNWRSHIKSPDDIWNEIVAVTQLPGVTSAPKLQPIQTRLLMLQTGMRAPMGIKIQGQSLEQLEAFGLVLESVLKEVEGVKKETVFAERIIGKPYLLLDIDRNKMTRYGLRVEAVQKVLEVALGGKVLTQYVEGRSRYGIRVRYPRELRDTPEAISRIHVPLANGQTVPLKEVVNIRYERGPQVIKSEDSFLVSYVLFDIQKAYAEMDVIAQAQKVLGAKIAKGTLQIPTGVHYKFTGTYEQQQRASKTLSVVIPIALGIIFLILYLQFRSVSTSLFVFAGIAVAFAGGFMMMWCYGQDWFMNIDVFGTNCRDLFQMHPIHLSVAVWVGFIALFGIATDDGVLMATYLTQAFSKNVPQTIEGVRAAVLAAGEKRIRPCLMTTATTLLALLPILTATGKGSAIMVPMAIPAFGGMSFALITVFVVPVLFCWNAEIKIRRRTKLNTDS